MLRRHSVPGVRARAVRLLTLCAVCLSASVSITFFGIAKYDLSDPATTDVHQYIAIYNGEDLGDIAKPFRYRFVVPEIARIVPSPPSALAWDSAITGDQIVKFKFGIVNIIALIVAGSALFSLLRFFLFDEAASLVGVLLFYLSFWVVLYGGIPLVDAGAYGALALGCLAAARRWRITLAATLLIGMFVKETTILVPVFALLLPAPRIVKLRQLALCAPGVIAYVIVRLVALPTSAGKSYSVDRTVRAVPDLFEPRAIFELIVAFGPLWILAAVGWWQARRGQSTVPGSLIWFVPAVGALTLANATSFGRTSFLSFPVVIAYALVGLRRIQMVE